MTMKSRELMHICHLQNEPRRVDDGQVGGKSKFYTEHNWLG